MRTPIFSDSVFKVTQRIYTYEMIKAIVGEYDADMWQAYQFTQGEADEAYAIDLNTRTDKVLRLNDRRTRGYKYMQRRRKAFDKDYEKRHPRPPRKELMGLGGII